ncbi:MAG: 2-hydroxyacid dehydrogenase [Hyphomicrobiaceae bacterium]
MSQMVILSTGLMMQSMVDAMESGFEVRWLNRIDDKDAFLRANGAHIAGLCTGAHTGVKTDKALLDRLPNLKIIGNYGVGYDSIDVAETARRGIVITNTPDVLNEEVADTAIGLLIMTVREFSQAEKWLRAGQWAATAFDYPFTASLRDRKVGLIGYGRIGKAIGRRLEAFGVPMCYFGRRKQPDVELPFYSDLVAMARDVDTLIAILPGGPATEKLIDAKVFKALGPRGIFINMARGSVVDEPALKVALRSKTILAAGLDVFWNEPNIDQDLLTIENLTPLPHVGSGSIWTRNKMGQLVVDNLAAYRDGKPPLTPVAETPFKGW